MVIAIAGFSVFFDYDYGNDNRLADNNTIQQSCFWTDTTSGIIPAGFAIP
jgi:hypothetical protein